jgi:type II secretory pathway pseudopilin PulG/cytoskeletal protein CcmA (bactofilin family)
VKGLQNEHGIALPMALGFMMVISISLAVVLELSRSSQRHSNVSRAEQTASAGAEAALNHAQSVLANAPDPTSSSALPPAASPETISVEGGTAQYWGSMDTAPTPDRWTITAVSSVNNPSGGSNVTHSVTAQFDVSVSTAIVGNEAWNYVFSNTTTTCFRLQNDFDVYAPLYVQGNYCGQNDGDYRGPLLDVRGTVQQSNSADIGSALVPVPQVRVGGGCRLGSSGPFSSPCTSAQRVWASSFSNSPPALTKPVLDAVYWQTNAKPGPSQYCTSGSFPGGAASFTTPGNVLLTPGSSYDCTVTQGSTTVGRIAWNNTTKALTIQGVVYFTGNLEFDGNFNGTYSGSGVIYANAVNFRNDAKLCAVPLCPTVGWDPNAALLVLAARSVAANAISLSNATKFQGAVYAVGGFRIQNSATMHGPVIAETVDVQNGGFIGSWPPLTSLLPGMPSNGGSAAASTTYVPGSWRG